jgi:hypothetical protein
MYSEKEKMENNCVRQRRRRIYWLIVNFNTIFIIIILFFFFIYFVFVFSFAIVAPLSYFVTVMVARIHLADIPLVEDSKIYRRIFGGYGFSVAAIPFVKSHLVCFCFSSPRVDRTPPHQTSGLE